MILTQYGEDSCLLWRAFRKRFERVDHDVLCEQLGEDFCSAVRGVKEIKRDAGSAEGFQSFRNFGVSIRPVGDEELDVVLLKGPLHVFSIKYGQLVGLAGDAPRGGEVDKDWASLIERSL